MTNLAQRFRWKAVVLFVSATVICDLAAGNPSGPAQQKCPRVVLSLDLDFDQILREWLDDKGITQSIERQLWAFVMGPLDEKVERVTKNCSNSVAIVHFFHDKKMQLPERTLNSREEDPRISPLKLLHYRSMHSSVRVPEAEVLVICIDERNRPVVVFNARLRYDNKSKQWEHKTEKGPEKGKTGKEDRKRGRSTFSSGERE